MSSRIVMSRALVGLAVCVAASVPARAQIINQQQTIQTGPARDNRQPAQKGTAMIRGQVVAADSGRPLRRARITLTAPELGIENRTTSTGLDGRYQVKDLPAGRYNVAVNRSGYLPLRYGQRRPLEQGKPLQIADKQVVEKIDFALPRMSVISGRITDEMGEPIADVIVWAMRSMYFQGRRKLVPAGGGPGSRTDDTGQYRILGLVPGTYFVMASIREMWSVTDGGVEQTYGYAPTFYPAAKNVSDARRVTVGVGQEASTIDFPLIPGKAANVSGMAADSKGRPLAGQSVNLMQEVSGPNMTLMSTAGSATVPGDGTFTIKNVPPGEYKIQARATTDGRTPGTQVQEAATAVVVVDGVDVDNISLMTTAGWSMSGHVLTDTGVVPGVRDRIRVNARLVSSDSDPRTGAPSAGSGQVRDDGSFVVNGVFGAARVRVTLPDGWAVKSVLQDGREIADEANDMKSGEELTGVRVIVTDQVTNVSGRLTDSKGAPLTDGTVILFAADAEKWSEDSRFVRSARPDQEGQYRIRGLPPGEYLAIALTYVEDGMWNDPEYLSSLRESAQELTLKEGASDTISLKLLP